MVKNGSPPLQRAISTWRDFADLGEFEAAAERVMAAGPRAMIQEGAGRNATVRANRTALDSWALRTRVLVDVSTIDESAAVLGTPISLPVLIGPTGLHCMSHPEAELATARGTSAADTLMILSASTSRSMSEVRLAANGGPTWFQMYWGEDRERMRSLVRMAEETGCTGLAITVDMPVRPVLAREMLAGVAAVGHEQPMYVLPRSAHTSGGVWDHDARLTWSDLAWLRECTQLPIILKGIMTGEDAALAVKHGIDAVVVSNHGGRALETRRGTLDVLPEVVDAVDGALEVYVDGGVRTGHDVAVCLALGANAVLIGRPVTWGLAVGGADGVRAVLDILRTELRSVMGMVGAPNLEALTRDRVTRVHCHALP